MKIGTKLIHSLRTLYCFQDLIFNKATIVTHFLPRLDLAGAVHTIKNKSRYEIKDDSENGHIDNNLNKSKTSFHGHLHRGIIARLRSKYAVGSVEKVTHIPVGRAKRQFVNTVFKVTESVTPRALFQTTVLVTFA